ncbi:MAG: hypothetical protein K2Q03_03635 [Sphingobacteriaceae bacterium]|nr:hypothetical protein [Sphingobacteriaceae bacterium]
MTPFAFQQNTLFNSILYEKELKDFRHYNNHLFNRMLLINSNYPDVLFTVEYFITSHRENTYSIDVRFLCEHVDVFALLQQARLDYVHIIFYPEPRP